MSYLVKTISQVPVNNTCIHVKYISYINWHDKTVLIYILYRVDQTKILTTYIFYIFSCFLLLSTEVKSINKTILQNTIETND